MAVMAHFSFSPRWSQTLGFTLLELLTVIGLSATLISMATPGLQLWLWRLQVQTVVQSWSADLQGARLQALRSGQTFRMQRLSNCQTQPLAQGDWRCGWQLLRGAGNSASVTLHTALAGEVSVQISPAQNSLDINALGEPVAGGLRVVVQARPCTAASCVKAICINTAGRLRIMSGNTCT
jgi:Tfp pilus assembly protein FimT